MKHFLKLKNKDKETGLETCLVFIGLNYNSGREILTASYSKANLANNFPLFGATFAGAVNITIEKVSPENIPTLETIDKAALKLWDAEKKNIELQDIK